MDIIEELNQVRKCIFNSFCKKIPHTRSLVSLSIIDDTVLKILGNEIENFLEDFFLRSKREYFLHVFI